MADEVRRLRRIKEMPAFAATLEIRAVTKNKTMAAALAASIRHLRSARQLPLAEDTLIEFPGQVFCHAHWFAPSRWLYYRIEPGGDENIVLMAVHDHLHEQ